MGKKKNFNWKGRQIIKTDIDNAETLKIKVNLDTSKEKYDECNQLVLPSKKRLTKKQHDVVKGTKILSKTQKKKLQKIVDKKIKKVNRSTLLEALAQVQIPVEELNQLTNVASVQTKGLKRHFKDYKSGSDVLNHINLDSQEIAVNSISGSKRMKRILEGEVLNKSCQAETDPNILGFMSFSSSDSDDCNTEEELKSKKVKNCLDQKAISKSLDKEDIEKKVVTYEYKPAAKGKLKKVSALNKEEKKTIINKTKKAPAVFVPVKRFAQLQEERLKLPILAYEQEIMEAINENSVVIIAGETGSGKTTQVPQFLYEAGYARNNKIIGITQPRRVAAISMSKRVSEEMSLSMNEVSYLIRFEGNVTENTKIKFMTDGVLLKEIQSDFILSKYSVIILDEAHERSIYTDILIGLLSRIVPLRHKRKDPLKLIIMSATLRVEDFSENSRLFKIPPPSIKVEARQYPVTVYFNKKTSDNYLKDCFLKTCKIHTNLPEGGILVFVTGQQEVNCLVRKLRKTFPFTKENKDDFDKSSTDILCDIKKFKNKNNFSRIKINLDKYSVLPNDDTEIDLLENDDLDIFNEECSENEIKAFVHEPLWVLPMYSLLSTAEQAKVFSKPPEGCRLCVVTTNVAETSLTIPYVKYVVDSGKTKIKLYDKITGVTSFQITWCSKASANQRAGRAGRIGPGYCYRLYSSAVFNDEFPQYSVPEIQQKPIDDLILQMKSMNIVKVLNFPFPTSPDLLQLKSGEKRLRILGALEKPTGKDEWCSKLTKLGKTMASFPVSPCFAKMLALSYQYDLLQYTICIVAALSVSEILLNNDEENKWSQLFRNWAGVGNSLLLGDIMVLLHAVGAAEYSKDNLQEFCSKNGLRYKAMVEIRKIRVQLTNQINLNMPELNLFIDPNLKPPTDTEAKLLRQILLSGLADHVAHKINVNEIEKGIEKIKWKKAYRDSEMEEPMFLHSHSVLKKHMPDWVVYLEVYESNKMYMRGVAAIEPEWLPVFVPSLCNLSEPLVEPPPRYDSDTGKVFCHVNGTFGKAALSLPTMEIPLTSTLMSYKWFAKFFLDGAVFPKLKKYSSILLSAPVVMTKSWAKLQPRTEILLSTLMTKEANTREQVLKTWKQDPFYLLEAYKSWLPESAQKSVTSIWPPI